MEEPFENRWRSRLLTLAVCLLGIGLYFYYFYMTAEVEVDLQVTKKTEFKIYWAKDNQGYSEFRESGVYVRPDVSSYKFLLTNIGAISKLRIDTHAYQGKAILRKLVIRQRGFDTIIVASPEDFQKLKIYSQIDTTQIDEKGLWLQSTGNDPSFEFALQPHFKGYSYGWLPVRLLFIGGLCWFFLMNARKLGVNLRFVPLLLFGVFLLIVVMAGLSKYNSHPDEYVHMKATAYYADHWLPPVVGDSAIRDTYSVYGFSRLNNGEVYYLFAGKFYNLMKTMRVSDNLALRSFNIFLFGLIILHTIRSNYARMVALPFLLSCQIWYVFSYCASDCFALYFSFLAAWQMVDPESLLHRYLTGESAVTKIWGALGLGVLLGLIILLKKNYYPFVALLCFCLVIKMFFSTTFYWERKAAIFRALGICLIGCVIAGMRWGADYWVNGMEREEKLATLQEELATPLFKPSTPLEKKHPFLYRKARGATLTEVIQIDRWFEKTFRSAFGQFGYFTISTTDGYYNCVRWVGVGLLLYVLLFICIRGGWAGLITSGAVLGLSAALIGVSLYHSWVDDFQTQGRYLFPIVPMLGLLYAWNEKAVPRQFLTLGTVVMYCLGLYFFIFVGIAQVPKV